MRLLQWLLACACGTLLSLSVLPVRVAGQESKFRPSSSFRMLFILKALQRPASSEQSTCAIVTMRREHTYLDLLTMSSSLLCSAFGKMDVFFIVLPVDAADGAESGVANNVSMAVNKLNAVYGTVVAATLPARVVDFRDAVERAVRGEIRGTRANLACKYVVFAEAHYIYSEKFIVETTGALASRDKLDLVATYYVSEDAYSTAHVDHFATRGCGVRRPGRAQQVFAALEADCVALGAILFRARALHHVLAHMNSSAEPPEDRHALARSTLALMPMQLHGSIIEQILMVQV